MQRRTIFLGGLVAVVLAAGLVFWLLVNANHASSSTQTPTPSISGAAHRAVISAANVMLLEQALNSPDITKQVNALALELRADFLAQGQSMLPPGIRVKLKPDTFLVSNDIGQMKAITSDNQTYLLRLVLENSTWFIVDTEAA